MSSWGLSWFNSWANSWGLSSAPSVVTRGGIADYRQYQKKLRRIAAAADKRLYKKASKRIDVLAKEDLPPVIERQVAAIQIDLSAILDKGVLAQNTLLIEQIKKLDLLIEQFILQQQKREDEIIILLMA